MDAIVIIYSLALMLCLQRKANGVDISIDAGELEGLSADELQRRYAEHSRGNAGVSGSREDMSDIMAKGMSDMAKKKQKTDDRDKDRKKGKDFKF